jgi:hypothetical protein
MREGTGGLAQREQHQSLANYPGCLQPESGLCAVAARAGAHIHALGIND